MLIYSTDMINLSSAEINRVYGFEKRLLSFRGYSFRAYSELKIINSYMQLFVTRMNTNGDDRHLTDMVFEIENETECLFNLRSAEDKDEVFKSRVYATLNIVQQFIKYLPAYDASFENNTFWGRFKDWLHLT